MTGEKIVRANAEVIEEASAKCFNPFFEQHIDSDNTKVLTDGWRGYWPLESEYEIRQKPSKSSQNFVGMYNVIINLKG